MKQLAASQALAARVATVAGADHYVGTVPATPARRYTVWYPAPGSPDDRRMDGQARRATAASRVLCVGNSADAAAVLAESVCGVLDGWLLDDALCVCAVSAPVAEGEVTAGYRWSCTVTVDHSIIR